MNWENIFHRAFAFLWFAIGFGILCVFAGWPLAVTIAAIWATADISCLERRIEKLEEKKPADSIPDIRAD